LIDKVVQGRLDKKGGAASLTEALQNAGNFHWFEFSRDVYSTGYEQIRKYTDLRADLSLSDRINLRDNLMIAYTDQVNKLTPEQKKNKEFYASQILKGDGKQVAGVIQQFAVFNFGTAEAPNYIRPGQIVERNGMSQLFLGLDENGQYRFLMPKSFVKEAGK